MASVPTPQGFNFERRSALFQFDVDAGHGAAVKTR
jgi:hypothetical protein